MEFLRAGTQSYILLLAFLLFCCGTQSLYVICDWWLSRWLALEEITNVTSTREYHPKEVLSDRYRYDWLVFLGLTIGCLFVSIVRAILTASLVINASRVLHNKMFYKILKAPLYFFHKTPIGNHPQFLLFSSVPIEQLCFKNVYKFSLQDSHGSWSSQISQVDFKQQTSINFK
ncbi:hypothetical protein ACOME3_000912 [Neoechinorhynchus agilis]